MSEPGHLWAFVATVPFIWNAFPSASFVHKYLCTLQDSKQPPLQSHPRFWIVLHTGHNLDRGCIYFMSNTKLWVLWRPPLGLIHLCSSQSAYCRTSYVEVINICLLEWFIKRNLCVLEQLVTSSSTHPLSSNFPSPTITFLDWSQLRNFDVENSLPHKMFWSIFGL